MVKTDTPVNQCAYGKYCEKFDNEKCLKFLFQTDLFFVQSKI